MTRRLGLLAADVEPELILFPAREPNTGPLTYAPGGSDGSTSPSSSVRRPRSSACMRPGSTRAGRRSASRRSARGSSAGTTPVRRRIPSLPPPPPPPRTTASGSSSWTSRSARDGRRLTNPRSSRSREDSALQAPGRRAVDHCTPGAPCAGARPRPPAAPPPPLPPPPCPRRLPASCPQTDPSARQVGNGVERFGVEHVAVEEPHVRGRTPPTRIRPTTISADTSAPAVTSTNTARTTQINAATAIGSSNRPRLNPPSWSRRLRTTR